MRSHFLVVSLAVVGATSAASATILQSTAANVALFATAVGGRTDTFSDLTINDTLPTTIARTAGMIGYSVVSSVSTVTPADSAIYVVPIAGFVGIGVSVFDDSLTFRSFSTPVRAFGGNFIATNVLGEVTGGAITVTVTDVNNLSFTRTLTGGSLTGFLGFTSDVNLASVLVRLTTPVVPSGTIAPTFISADNIVLSATAAAVPEPAPVALLGWGLMGVGFARNRSRAA